MKHFVIIGSSRGLGAAVVDILLKETDYIVSGVSRSKISQIERYDQWLSSGRYRHLAQDITSSNCIAPLRKLICDIPSNLTCIIFNAASLEKDVKDDNSFNAESIKRINRVGINGFINVLESISQHLQEQGGILVGISSFSAMAPPIFEPRLAYPASKAYLDMMLKCLRNIWRGRVKIVTVHLGHIGRKNDSNIADLSRPYLKVAKQIIKKLDRKRVPSEINYPFFPYTIFYKYFMRICPDYLGYLLTKYLILLLTLKR